VQANSIYDILAWHCCLLTLARGAFDADEVVAEILRRVRVTAAEIDT
jgi:hypothetical protein